MKKKIPLIDLLKTQYPAIPEKEAFARIMCGEVFIEGERVREPGRSFHPEVCIELKSRKFVSRGGNKLEPVLEAWKVDVKNKVFVDAGSSTGGFTDCLLKRGALAVHAVDVGYNQLDYRLRTDRRVKVHERTNIMSVGELVPAPHAAVADLSFRKIRGAARYILDLVSEKWLIALVKPQFEILPGMDDSFTGVVESPVLQERILQKVAESLISEGIRIKGILPSPISGRKGNREFFFYLAGEIETDRSSGEYLSMITRAIPQRGRGSVF